MESNIKCYHFDCTEKPIIRFTLGKYDKRSFCLEHLIEFLKYIRDNKLFHLLEQTKEIIPIYWIK